MSAVDYRAQTVLITGASAGLGAEFARKLAARGAGLVLVARRADRLAELQAELTAAGGTVTTIAMDLAVPDAGERLHAALAGTPVTSMINNAGFGTNRPFHEEDPGRVTDEITLNVTSLVGITRAFIDELRAGHGFLINLASVAAYQPNPRMAVYGATKAFVLSFSEALWYESRGTGLRVLAVSPGATETEFFEVAGQGADGGTRRMRADQVVDAALRALDRRNPPPSVVTGALNKVMTGAGRLVSRRMLASVVGTMLDRSAERLSSRV
ncbi:short-subunit dehydrogenase [Actinoplanes octamycinicus]|uniref:Short-subunit dehydrogenase n=1 Tax=Actinoplanes octamycinicus TaxID=135948 RepID=A0A7W7MC86_9ACTN|nr:SDR family oxidoreductase [Actinoplanes octamycinicus]MBB4744904.1 short-subunit dehydrogenase [Actinoplanes octamycinicus]